MKKKRYCKECRIGYQVIKDTNCYICKGKLSRLSDKLVRVAYFAYELRNDPLHYYYNGRCLAK